MEESSLKLTAPVVNDKKLCRLKPETFAVIQPEIHSYSPKKRLDEVVTTISGKGFGEFFKISEATRLIAQPGSACLAKSTKLGQDVSRSEVLVSGVAVAFVSWSDTEITIRVPRRPAYGFGNPKGFNADLSRGELILKRGSWDMLDTGECCTPKEHYYGGCRGHLRFCSEDFLTRIIGTKRVERNNNDK